VEALVASGRIRPFAAPSNAGSRTRSFVRVQDGCDNGCAYCIVPLVRGGDRSVHADRVISEVAGKASRGYNEVVLTGTEIGGYHSNGIELGRLLERLLAENRRPPPAPVLSSAAGGQSGLLEPWRDGRLCRHFHLSLQSGSDSVLERMGRRYSAGDHQRAVSQIREAVPGAAITTDVIVGFPGETESEFAESYDFSGEWVSAGSTSSSTRPAPVPGPPPCPAR